MNDVTKRFLEVYNHLLNEGLVSSPSEFAREINVSTSTVTEICKKRTEAGLKPIKGLLDRFSRINPNWLLKGEGVMQVDDNSHVAEPNSLYERQLKKGFLKNNNGNYFKELDNGKFKIFVRKLPVRAFGSYLSEFQNLEFINELEEVTFTVDHLGRGKYMSFEVEGDSMNGGGMNDTPEGAELLVRELGNHHWKDGFRESKYGWVIIHTDTVLFKDIKDFNIETGDITCSSRSGLPQHSDFTINLDQVKQIFKVIKRTF